MQTQKRLIHLNPAATSTDLNRGRRLLMTLGAGAICGLAESVVAQSDYPSRQIRIVVPFSAGSGSDAFARLIGPRLAAARNQPVVVENREGAGGVIGATYVSKASADGYTLLLGALAWSIAPSLYRNAPYDPVRDFAPVGRIGYIPQVLVVTPSLGLSSVKDVIRMARTRPGSVNYASSGKGTPSHLFMEYLKGLAKVDIQEIPYKNSAQALTDVISGQVMMNLPNIAAALPHIRSGRLKALAVTTPTRSAIAPDIPTMAESAGLPEYAAAHWQGLIAPAGTPPEIILRLNNELNRILQMADVMERLTNLGVDVVPSTPAQISEEVRIDVAKWSHLVKTMNLALD